MRKIDNYCKAILVGSLSLLLPAFCIAGADDVPKAGSDTPTSEARLAATAVLNSADSADAQAPQKARTGSREAGQVGVGIRLSTLGPGAEVSVSLTHKLNLRGGFNFFQYDRRFDHDGITYRGQLQLRSGEAHLDFYPFGHGFHVSPGLLVYNGNDLNANANVPPGAPFTLGGTTYVSDPTNPISGRGKLDFRKAAPSVLLGFGNLVPRTKHFSVNFETGVVFQGGARTTLNLTGNACDPAGLNCVNAATDPTVQASVKSEEIKINNKVSSFKYYPVISFGLGYRF